MIRDIKINSLLVSFILFFVSESIAQVNIQGSVSYNDNPIEFTRVSVYPLSKHVLTNVNGAFSFSNVPLGKYIIEWSAIGFKSISDTVDLSKPNDTIQLALSFTEKIMELDAVVVTGTKTYKRQTNSNIIVNVINSESLDMVQACSLSEGLKFQPGLRVAPYRTTLLMD